MERGEVTTGRKEETVGKLSYERRTTEGSISSEE